ncbi:cytochrome P450 [Striga asiatica]|uniref:Cytochrome P450 n=1 Tax=Striga asiatica TaxID=4170 RepID=A0A5A7QZ70_STRAF|nr:cytochrome P450 [Striga asiatica]
MTDPNPNLPARKIPGDYGPPFFGPIRDRFRYFYTEGEAHFFRARMQKHNSTVFRTNMPPGPFMARDPRVICLLDALSFRTLFDNSRVEKRDVLDGTFVPSTSFTGRARACAYLDPSEPKHALLKAFFLDLLAKSHHKIVPLFRESLVGLFSGLEARVSSGGPSGFNDLSDSISFEFVFRLLCDGKSPSETELGPDGPKLVDLWLFAQLAPLVKLGLKFVPSFLEDLILHTFPIPFALVKNGYAKLYRAFRDSAGPLLDEAEKLGFGRDEACHNLVFLAGFNAYGGMKALFPILIKWVGSAGEALHRQLRAEIRAVFEPNGPVTLTGLDQLVLTKSVVYEALRLDPPVPYQYGRAKCDFDVRSHDSSFEVKKGEMLFGYQPFATRDPRVFERADEFWAERFVGDGERLLEYVYWSNGPETEDPAVGNKQCPGKGMVVILCRLMLVEFFLRYDTFEVEVGRKMLGWDVKFKSLTRASD